jgi:hypothetical protein
MKTELEAESRNARLEADLAAARSKLETMVQTIPQEFHHLPREIYERLKAIFA